MFFPIVLSLSFADELHNDVKNTLWNQLSSPRGIYVDLENNRVQQFLIEKNEEKIQET